MQFVLSVLEPAFSHPIGGPALVGTTVAFAVYQLLTFIAE